LYATYLGGNGPDRGRGIAVDVAGNAYVTGSAGPAAAPAPAFPSTAGAFDPSHNGDLDAFVAKLDSTGGALLYSGFLGTAGTDEGFGIAVDAAGNAYVTGAMAAGFAITPGAYDAPSNAAIDAFVAKIDTTGSTPLYATLVGGGSTDRGHAITIDAFGNAYVTGQTFSTGLTGFPTTPGAFDAARGGPTDAFVTKVNPAGSGLVFSTYLGGHADDEIGRGIAVDAGFNVYVTGQTFSGGAASDLPTGLAFPTTVSAFDRLRGATRDAFVTKLNPGGSALLYSTYLGGEGGSGIEDGTSIAVDASGHIHVTGNTSSSDFPTASGAGDFVDATFAGGSGSDAFVTTINPAGGGASDLVYSTYLGGTNNESGTGIAIDADGNAYVTGVTASSVANGFPSIAGSFDTTHNGANDAFILKLGTLVLTTTLDPAEATNNVGTEHCVIASVEDQLGNAVPGVTVFFNVTGAIVTSGSVTTVAGGQATFCYVGPATPGADAITAWADANGNGIQDPAELNATATKTWADQFDTTTTVTSTGSPTTFGEPVTFTATVTASVAVAGGTVTFQEGATVLAGPIAVNPLTGQASFTISSLPVGSHTITAYYNGTATFTESSGSIDHTVSRSGTATTVSSSLNPSTYGEEVEFTATVIPATAGVPTGSVTFFDGPIAPENAIGTSSLDASGHAVLVISTLAAADHSIRAVYSGDAAFNPSASPVLVQIVTPAATTTTLSSSRPSPTVFGETVTFTARVEGPGVEIPTGTVEFSDGTTVLGTVTVDADGNASIALSSLSVGPHTINAVYAPANTNFTGSSATPLAHDVELAPTSTTVMSAPNPSVYTEEVTITAEVTAVAPGAYTLAFAGPASVAAGPGTGTFAVASGDFNGDGSVDLVSANRTSNNVSIILGAGDGTFGPPAFFGLGTGTSPSYVVAADLDGDGDLDLVTTNEGSSNVSVLAGNGDGTFGAAANFSTVGGSGASAVAVGEFHGASSPFLDLVVSNAGSTNITVRRGNGMLDFTPGSNFGTGARPLHVTTGDFDADADVDIASVNFSPSTISLRVNNGAGAFPDINTAPLSPGVGPVAFVVADLNADGRLDAATANRTSGDVTVRTDLQTTTPVTGPATVYSLGADSDGVMVRPEYLVGADFNGDGRLDLAVTDSEHTYVRILTGTGGSFEFPQTFTTGVPAFPFASNAPGRRFIAADLNGDGRLDLAFPTLEDDIRVLLNTGVGPTGFVQFFDDGTPIGPPVAVVDGSATLTTSTLAVGTHTLSVRYASDGNYEESTGEATHVVGQAQTTTAVTSSVNPSFFGQPVTFTASVAAVAPAAGTPTGTVAFRDNGTLIGTAALDGSGRATFTTSTLAVGAHTITAEYLGDGSFLASAGSVDQTVSQAGTTTAVTSSVNPSVSGQSVTFTATVAAVAPSAGTPTGTVEFRDNGTVIGSAALDGSGHATFDTSTLAVGAHTITAEYLGDGGFLGSSGAVEQIVTRASTTTTLTSSVNPSVYGQSVTFTATVSAVAPGAGTPIGTVQFLDNGTPMGAPVALSGGAATFATSALTVGSHTITAQYSGDGNFLISSGSVVQTVNKGSTTTLVTSSVNPSVAGQSVTFTATVSAVAPGAGTPNGSVQFLDNGTPLGAPVVLSGGRATLNTSALTAGSHTITAQYLGDGNFNVSAGTVTQTVNPAANPVLTLTKSVDKATANPGGTLVYTLTFANKGTGPATGVMIRDVVPAHTTFVSASGGGTNSGGTVSWTIGNLAPGASGSVTLTVRINEDLSCSDGPGGCALTVTNKGTITSNQTPTVTSSNTVTTQVHVQPQAAHGRMTGGGTFGSQRVHHGFTLRCDPQANSQRLEVNWGKGNKFHLEQLTSATCLDDPKIGPSQPRAGFDTYRGAGTGRYNGAPATVVWTFTDAGEPGRNDTSQIVVRDAAGRIVLSASGSISNGNHQAH
jgi:uncharacterized repeat protein (TIGR01451 family)